MLTVKDFKLFCMFQSSFIKSVRKKLFQFALELPLVTATLPSALIISHLNCCNNYHSIPAIMFVLIRYSQRKGPSNVATQRTAHQPVYHLGACCKCSPSLPTPQMLNQDSELTRAPHNLNKTLNMRSTALYDISMLFLCFTHFGSSTWSTG